MSKSYAMTGFRIGYACDKQTLRDGLAALAAFADTLA